LHCLVVFFTVCVLSTSFHALDLHRTFLKRRFSLRTFLPTRPDHDCSFLQSGSQANQALASTYWLAGIPSGGHRVNAPLADPPAGRPHDRRLLYRFKFPRSLAVTQYSRALQTLLRYIINSSLAPCDRHHDQSDAPVPRVHDDAAHGHTSILSINCET
jgi:hypothetical protein